MSILKSTCSGKHMPLTIDYLLAHGWYHTWRFEFGGGKNVNKNTLVRCCNLHGEFRHGELEIYRSNGNVFFYCKEYHTIRGLKDTSYKYLYEYRPKTVHDLEQMIAFWDEPKANKKYDLQAKLYHEEFVHAEVMHT